MKLCGPRLSLFPFRFLRLSLFPRGFPCPPRSYPTLVGFIGIYIWVLFLGTVFLHRGSRIHPQCCSDLLGHSPQNTAKSGRAVTRTTQKIGPPPGPSARRDEISCAVDPLTPIFVPEGHCLMQLGWSEVLHKPMNKTKLKQQQPKIAPTPPKP